MAFKGLAKGLLQFVLWGAEKFWSSLLNLFSRSCGSRENADNQDLEAQSSTPILPGLLHERPSTPPSTPSPKAPSCPEAVDRHSVASASPTKAESASLNGDPKQKRLESVRHSLRQPAAPNYVAPSLHRSGRAESTPLNDSSKQKRLELVRDSLRQHATFRCIPPSPHRHGNGESTPLNAGPKQQSLKYVTPSNYHAAELRYIPPSLHRPGRAETTSFYAGPKYVPPSLRHWHSQSAAATRESQIKEADDAAGAPSRVPEAATNTRPLKQVQNAHTCDDDQPVSKVTDEYRYTGSGRELGRTALSYYTSEDYDAMLEGDYGYESSEEESEPDKKLYERLREQAEFEGNRMAQAFKEATQANTKGNGAAARRLVKKANHHKAQMEKYKEQAADLIFMENNADREKDTVDLHGLTVAEAEAKAQDFVSKAFRRGVIQVKIITGKGNHSVGQRPKIKPSVEQLMMHLGHRVSEHPRNAGMILVGR